MKLNIVPFCEYNQVIEFQNQIEFVWADPREIEEIVVDVQIPTNPAPSPNSLNIIKQVEYWRQTWPKNRPNLRQKRGSGQSGWTRQDDWFRGYWHRADINLHSISYSETLINTQNINLRTMIRFNDLNQVEFPQESYSINRRRTLKIRITFDSDICPIKFIKSIQIFTESELLPISFKIERFSKENTNKNGHYNLQIFNGFVRKSDSNELNLYINPKCQFSEIYEIWGTIPLYSENFDGTLVTIDPHKYGQKLRKFTFAIEDLVKFHSISIPDLDYEVIFEKKDQHITQNLPEHAQQSPILRDQIKKVNNEFWSPDLGPYTVYDRIKQVPERQFSDAMEEFAGKKIFYAVLGCEGVRTKCTVNPSGFLSIPSRYNRQVPQADTPRIFWQQECAQFRFFWGIDAQPDLSPPMWLKKPIGRSFKEQYPIFTTKWQTSKIPIQIHQKTFLTILEGTTPGREPKGDAIPINMLTFLIINQDKIEHKIELNILIGESPNVTGEDPFLRPLFPGIEIQTINQQNGNQLNRLKWHNFANQNSYLASCTVRMEPINHPNIVNFREEDEVLYISFDLLSMETAVIEFKLPLLRVDNHEQLEQLDFTSEEKNVIQYWQQRFERATRIEIPEEEISVFYRKHLMHMLITNDREIGSNRIIGRVGSTGYGCYANEVCMMTMDLDRRGMFDTARRMLDTFIHYQGTVGLDGAYEEIDGIYYGAGGYQSGQAYNQSQGFVLWAIAEHVRLSQDWEWFRSIKDSVIKACEWINNERHIYANHLDSLRKTQWATDPNSTPFLQYGLMPPGGVEDISDYQFWLSTNAYNSFGMSKVVDLLQLIGDSKSPELMKEAQEYRLTIISAFLKAMERSPIVKIRDGTFIPHIPCHVMRRGRGFGWIQEVLEGAIHLIRTGMLEPNSLEATWIIKDLEDNCYLSEEFGYPLLNRDFDQYWFTRGGFSMQPFLLSNHMVYALRNDPKHFLRAVFNSFAVNYRPDTKMFTEHPLPTMFDWFGNHYKTSDEAQFCSCIRTMICQEIYPDSLRILGFIPESWLYSDKQITVTKLPTYFGWLDLFTNGNIKNQKTIIITLTRNKSTNYPKLSDIRLHLRRIEKSYFHITLKQFKIDNIGWTPPNIKSDGDFMYKISFPTRGEQWHKIELIFHIKKRKMARGIY